MGIVDKAKQVSLLVRLWVEMLLLSGSHSKTLSASLWGCELKYGIHILLKLWRKCQPPCEAVSWNTVSIRSFNLPSGQPPCEAVSWNNVTVNVTDETISQPPCEAVSWNWTLLNTGEDVSGQPPCEAVSWNFNQTITATGRIRSASLWGCELKCSRSRLHILHYSQPPCEAVSWNPFLGLNLTSAEVSLLVRLWVEMHMPLIHSSCNLVSLLVRLWVEMIPLLSHGRSGKSASLWGCELKLSWAVKKGLVETVSLLVRLWVEICRIHWRNRSDHRQPPCEAVSWNIITRQVRKIFLVSLLVRLWVEMWHSRLPVLQEIRQPPCEAVSWNLL